MICLLWQYIPPTWRKPFCSCLFVWVSCWWISQTIFVFSVLQAICQLFLSSGFILVVTVAPMNLISFFFFLLAALNIYFPFVITDFTIMTPGCFVCILFEVYCYFLIYSLQVLNHFLKYLATISLNIAFTWFSVSSSLEFQLCIC